MRSEADELTELSASKWRWMSERDVAALSRLVHDDAVFVHMGATFSKAQELEIIRSGEIEYRTVDVHEVSVPLRTEWTGIVLSTLDLVAVVGGNEVTNPFAVTEVFIRHEGHWQLASLSFTRLVSH